MRLTALVAIACLTALAFAGCSDKDGDGGETSSSTSSTSRTSSSSTTSGSKSSTSTTSSSTSTSTGPANQAPTGTISATVNGTAASFNLTGSDPDGDVVVWDLDFGDGNSTNGTVLPTTVRHNYTVSGNITVAFTVTDGMSPVSYNVTLNLTGGSSGPSLSFAGDVAVYCAQCTAAAAEQEGSPLPVSVIPSASWGSGEQGDDAIWTEVPAALAGRAFVASTTGSDVGLAAMSACDPTAKVLALFDDSGTPEAGTVPAGTGCFLMWEFPPVPPAAPATRTLTLVIA